MAGLGPPQPVLHLTLVGVNLLAPTLNAFEQVVELPLADLFGLVLGWRGLLFGLIRPPTFLEFDNTLLEWLHLSRRRRFTAQLGDNVADRR